MNKASHASNAEVTKGLRKKLETEWKIKIYQASEVKPELLVFWLLF